MSCLAMIQRSPCAVGHGLRRFTATAYVPVRRDFCSTGKPRNCRQCRVLSTLHIPAVHYNNFLPTAFWPHRSTRMTHQCRTNNPRCSFRPFCSVPWSQPVMSVAASQNGIVLTLKCNEYSLVPKKILTSRSTLEALSISNPRTDLETLARVIRGTSTVAEATQEAELRQTVLPQLTVARFSEVDRGRSSTSSCTSRRPR
jgi:hypothetical protein